MTPHFLPSFLPQSRLWRTIDIAFALTRPVARPYLKGTCVRACVSCLPPSLNSLKSVSHSSASTLDIVVSPPPPRRSLCGARSTRSTPRRFTAMPSRPVLSSRPYSAVHGRGRAYAPERGVLLRRRVRPDSRSFDPRQRRWRRRVRREERGRDDVSAASKGDESPTRKSIRSLAGCIAH